MRYSPTSRARRFLVGILQFKFYGYSLDVVWHSAHPEWRKLDVNILHAFDRLETALDITIALAFRLLFGFRLINRRTNHCICCHTDFRATFSLGILREFYFVSTVFLDFLRCFIFDLITNTTLEVRLHVGVINRKHRCCNRCLERHRSGCFAANRDARRWC